MPTRNVVLTKHQSDLIDTLVAGGRYQNASEVLREGIRLIEERDKEQAAKLAALRAAVQVGIDELDRGEYREFTDTKSLSKFMKKLTKDAISTSKRR